MNSGLHEHLRSAFFDQSDILFYLFDKDLNLIDVNENGLRTFHFTREAILGRNIRELSPDNQSSGRFEMYREVIRTGHAIQIDEMKPHPSLGNMYFRIKAFKVGDGLGLVSKNITDLKESIDELETFIYKASHDMRSPIARILGITGVAAMEIRDANEAKKFCQIVHLEAEGLDRILKSLMQTMGIRKGDVKKQLIDFQDIFKEIRTAIGTLPNADLVHIRTTTDDIPGFFSDKLAIVSIIYNLVENAVKYRKAIPEAFVHVQCRESDEGIKLIVNDNGVGIPSHLQQDIFRMFFRANAEQEGSGLGLFTVNQLVKKIGGTISVESIEKVGTTFTVRIPNRNSQPVNET